MLGAEGLIAGTAIVCPQSMDGVMALDGALRGPLKRSLPTKQTPIHQPAKRDVCDPVTPRVISFHPGISGGHTRSGLSLFVSFLSTNTIPTRKL